MEGLRRFRHARYQMGKGICGRFVVPKCLIFVRIGRAQTTIPTTCQYVSKIRRGLELKKLD